MSLEFRNIFRREGLKASIEAVNQLHERIIVYSTDGPTSFNEDVGYVYWLDDTFTKASPNFSTARHALFTLDDDLNPQMPIGENGIHFRDPSSPTDRDIDLLLVDNVTGIANRGSWPKQWWDHSEKAFTFRPIGTGRKVRIEDWSSSLQGYLDFSWADNADGTTFSLLSPFDSAQATKTSAVVDGSVRARKVGTGDSGIDKTGFYMGRGGTEDILDNTINGWRWVYDNTTDRTEFGYWAEISAAFAWYMAFQLDGNGSHYFQDRADVDFKFKDTAVAVDGKGITITGQESDNESSTVGGFVQLTSGKNTGLLEQGFIKVVREQVGINCDPIDADTNPNIVIGDAELWVGPGTSSSESGQIAMFGGNSSGLVFMVGSNLAVNTTKIWHLEATIDAEDELSLYHYGSVNATFMRFGNHKVGIGSDFSSLAQVSATVHIMDATEQLRIGFDALSYMKFTMLDATGEMQIFPVSDAGGGFMNLISTNTGKQLRMSFDTFSYTDFKVNDATGDLNIIPVGDCANGSVLIGSGAPTVVGANGLETEGSIHAQSVFFLPSYTVAGLSVDTTAGQIVYCSNGDAGSPCVAVHNGTNWKVVALGATVSAS